MNSQVRRGGDDPAGNTRPPCVQELTSVRVWTLETFSIQHMDLSDQLRVTAHPCPTGLRRLVQRQLSEETPPPRNSRRKHPRQTVTRTDTSN